MKNCRGIKYLYVKIMKPLILNFKVVRQPESQTPVFSYCHKTSLNVVVGKGGELPFVEAGVKELEFQTKTKVYRESDDFHQTLELKTKTEVKTERDDQHDCILEIKTKTLTIRERDDEGTTIN